MKLPTQILTALLLLLKSLNCAPLRPDSETRTGKNLGFVDYLQPEIDYTNYELGNEDYVDENDLSRTLPSRKRITQPYNSPIYYIRMPPSALHFVNLPVPFVANGKPSAIYQWSGAFEGFPTPAPPPPAVAKPKPQKPAKKPVLDSNVHRLPGSFTFNGKARGHFLAERFL
ncbi:hypothetical protein NQ317_000385 [Molorchus minor]|uniref:Uncharacterized protein n=1 Tax=Molorchus minor TaxID=1323400 RepID=A0ABQ9J9C3_9CUCU|nr:hypothetical protein NQ317_000385 [Molorchus minor]